MIPENCSKCNQPFKALIKVNIGTGKIFVQVEMFLCWKCFNEEFERHDDGKQLYGFKENSQ